VIAFIMTRTKRYQPARQDIFYVAVDERKFVFRSSGCQLEAPGIDEGVYGVDEALRAERQGLIKGCIDILGFANVQ
jgi:hypothetical protein